MHIIIIIMRWRAPLPLLPTSLLSFLLPCLPPRRGRGVKEEEEERRL